MQHNSKHINRMLKFLTLNIAGPLKICPAGFDCNTNRAEQVAVKTYAKIQIFNTLHTCFPDCYTLFERVRACTATIREASSAC